MDMKNWIKCYDTQIPFDDDKGSAKGLFWVSWASASDLSLARCLIIYFQCASISIAEHCRDSSGWHFLIKAVTWKHKNSNRIEETRQFNLFRDEIAWENIGGWVCESILFQVEQNDAIDFKIQSNLGDQSFSSNFPRIFSHYECVCTFFIMFFLIII